MLAASTSSQLGFMLLALGAGYPGAALAHLVAHAFMKSALFLAAGIFQHRYHTTGFAPLRGTGRSAKGAYGGFVVAGLALSGIPPLAGYWSKDAILAAGIQTSAPAFYFGVAVAGALLTALYMSRAFRLLVKKKAFQTHTPSKGSVWMQAGLWSLVLLTAGIGFVLEPIVTATDFSFPKEHLATLAGITAAAIGLAAGWWLESATVLGKAYHFVQSGYQIKGGYEGWIVKPVLQLAHYCAQGDQYLQQGVLGLGKLFLRGSDGIHRLDTEFSNFIQKLGEWNMTLSTTTRRLDEQGIERTIFQTAASTRNLGRYGRKLQSGLVHQELLWAVVGTLFVIVILLFV